MIGVFDSGAGGIISYREIRKSQPRADLIYLADRKNAPFGTKGAEEILNLTTNGLTRLRELGAEKILIACCSASTLYDRLPSELKKLSIPIIRPAARECCGSRSVVVIATEHTARCGAFRLEIAKFSDASVKEIPMQSLVHSIEWGEDTKIYTNKIKEYCREADTLILGCTHFSHRFDALKDVLPKVKIISPAHIGAVEMTKIKTDRGCGRDIYTS